MSQLLPLLLLPFLALLPTASQAPSAEGASPPGQAVQISFGDLLAPGPKLVPSPRLKALVGRRIRLVGFMAQLEEPPRGGFYLTSGPVRCDEGGAGTADLPPDAVRVIVRSAADQEIPFYPGAIEVSGVLAVGAAADPDGRPSSFRITLDRPEEIERSAPPAPPAAVSPPSPSRHSTPNGGQVP
jgi:hypothetical protein